MFIKIYNIEKTQLLQEIETLSIPDNSILASLDVTSLFPSVRGAQ